MWLLLASIREAFEQAQKSGSAPSAQQQLDYEARISSGSGEGLPRILTIAGNNAEIAIEGAITARPSLMAFIFGGGNTTYADINAALAVAEQDPEVDNITLAIDSPGGTIAGLFDTLAAIEAAKKPVKAVVSNVAASAAYAIASQADEIVATNRAAMFGSIGIVVRGFNDPDEFAITSTDAPKKAPDLSTEEGKAVIREELDALHEIFVDAIASGRSMSTDTINAEFGQGATLLAGEALKRGMIDAVADSSLSVVGNADSTTTANSGTQPEAIDMDLNTLKAQHADVYAAAVQEGVTQERDRVGAHVTMGEASGDMKTAITAINDGSTMTAQLQATYMAAGMNRQDVNNRQDDDAGADAGDGAGADEDTAKANASAATLNFAAAACGVEVEA